MVLKSLVCLFWLVLAGVILCDSCAAIAADHAPAPQATSAADADEDPLMNLLFPDPAKEVNYHLPPVQPKWQTFLWSLILFGGFVLVMRVTTWNPLIATLNNREARVLKAEAGAEYAREEIVKLQAEAEKRLATVQDEVKAIMAKARTEAESQKRQIIAEAEASAEQIRSAAIADLQAAHRDALSRLDELVEEQVAMATEHVVGRRL